MKLTFTMENYLEVIYELSLKSGGARVSDIANKLGVTKASTNNAMATLSDLGLVARERYKEIYLTEDGIKFAEAIHHKHKVVRSFLLQTLGIDFSLADREACAIEHVISNETVAAIERYLSSSPSPSITGTNIIETDAQLK
jgi:Mn-dependent DtxR family transcriptional regulator